jgi:single-stranded-DNA-specific exonuclease
MLDLVALSLVCDVVPLKGENRILLKEGLSRLRKTKRPAIEAICKTSRLKKENINTHHIGYILGPRINASGRVACARDSLEIFISNDKEKIFDTATKLEEYNLQRRDIEANILKEAQAQLDNNLTDDYAVVVAGDNWHSGVLGIVASRLVEKYYRPSFVISFDDEIGRGSARSIHSVHLMEVLENCAGSLQAYGGHQKAAGIEIFKAGLEDFRQAVNSFIKQNTRPQDLVPVLDIDLRLDFEEINVELLYQLERLEPFGEENPQPLFAASAIFKKSEPKKTPNGYRIWLSGKNTTCEALFYDKDFLEVFAAAEKFDIAYNLGRNNYHNSPVLIIRDLRFAGDKP